MFYFEIRFMFHIKDMDADLYLAWCRRSKHHLNSNHSFELLKYDKPLWSNLLTWLKAYHKKECDTPRTLDDPETATEPRTEGLLHLLDLANVCRTQGMKWRATKAALECVHRMLKTMDEYRREFD